jgi:hypothetical protein
VSANPVAPSAESELIAKPSTRICQNNIDRTRLTRGGAKILPARDEGGENLPFLVANR